LINLKISRIIFSALIAFVLLFSSSVILSNAQVGFFEESFPTGTAPIAVAVDEFNKRSYIVNSGSNSVTSIDTGPLVLLTPSISVGSNPKDVAIHKPNGNVYVTNFGSDTVSIIDEFSDTVIDTIAVGNGPDGIEVVDFIDRAFVVNTLDNSVSVINTFENTVVDTITGVGSSPEKMIAAFTGPSSEKLYVTSAGNNKIIIITRTVSGFTESYAVTGEITGLSGTPTDLAFDFSSNTLYAAITTASSVADVIDVIDVSGTPSVGTPITVGFGAHGLAIDEFAQFLYVTNRDSPSISVINTQTNIVDTTLTDTANIGFEPVGIFIDQFFSEIHVTDFTGNTLQVLEGEGGTFIDATFTGVLDQFFVSAFQSGTTSNPIKLTINSPTAETLHVFVGGLGIGMQVEFQTDCSGGFSDGSIDEIQISVLASTNKDVCIRFSSATSTPPGSYFAFIDVENFETGEFIGLGLDIPVTPAASFGPSIFLSPFTALPNDTVTVFATGFVSTSSCTLSQDIISNELFSDAGSCFDEHTDYQIVPHQDYFQRLSFLQDLDRMSFVKQLQSF